MLSHHDTALVRRLCQNEAVIVVKKGVDAHPAYKKGDRRKRPAFWVGQESFTRLQSMGGLASKGVGFVIAKSLEKRIAKPSANVFADQHRDIEDREIYIESGVRRPARFNAALSALDRLARRTDTTGCPLLSKPEYEAGQRFARDYALSGYDRIATQNYMCAGEDKTGYRGGEEHMFQSRLDARKRLKAARDIMGTGLDTAVIAVCCLDQNLAQIERAENWAKASGLTILKIGLGRLVMLYGTTSGQPPKAPCQS